MEECSADLSLLFDLSKGMNTLGCNFKSVVEEFDIQIPYFLQLVSVYFFDRLESGFLDQKNSPHKGVELSNLRSYFDVLEEYFDKTGDFLIVNQIDGVIILRPIYAISGEDEVDGDEENVEQKIEEKKIILEHFGDGKSC